MYKDLLRKYKFFFFLLAVVFFQFYFINSQAVAEDTNIDFTKTPSVSDYEQYIDEYDVYYKNGLKFLSSNQLTRAVDSFEKALEGAKSRIEIRSNLAISYINRGMYYYNHDKDYYKAANDTRNAIYILKYDYTIPNPQLVAENLAIAKTNLAVIMNSAQLSQTKSSRLKLARELRGQGKFREAIVEYFESLEGNQTDYPVYTDIADMYSALLNDENAVKYYKKALDYNKNNSELHFKLAKSLQACDDFDNALKEYELAYTTANKDDKEEILQFMETIWVKKLQNNPQDADAHMNLAVVLQKLGDYDEALKEYQFAESLAPNNVATRINLGTLYQDKKDYQTALSAYDTVIQVFPDNISAHYYRGTVLKDMANYDEAIKEFQYVLSLEPANIKAKEAYNATLKLLPKDDNYIAAVKNLADSNKMDADAQYKYAAILQDNKDFTGALEYYNRAILANPNQIDAYIASANLYKGLKQYNSAVNVLQTAIPIFPENTQLKTMLNSLSTLTTSDLYKIALKKHNEGKYQEAINDYLSIIKLSEPNSDLYVNLGAAYQAIKKSNEAINAYKKAISINTKNSTAYYYLGTIYAAQGKNANALVEYQKAQALDPNNNDIKLAIKASRDTLSQAELQKAINLYNSSKFSDALLAFNSLAMKDPANGTVFYYRGMVYDSMKKYQLAISDYKQAIKYKPDLSYSYYAVAVDYDAIKNYTEAKKWYKLFIDKSGATNDQYVKYAKDRYKQL